MDRSLNEAAYDKIWKYPTDYHKNPPKVISFMSVVPSTFGRIVNFYVFYCFRLIGKLTACLQFQEFSLCNPTMGSSTTAAPCSPQSSNQNARQHPWQGWVTVLRIVLNLEVAPIVSQTHSHPSHSQTSCLFTSSLSLGVPVWQCPPHNTVYP